MKFNSPLPQPLSKECGKAAKIFKSFVDGGNNGLDGVIPRNVLQNAKGFAIFTVFKAGFLFSARAGSGVVIAKLDDGTWSAPSAIGTAGLGIGGQAGAEVTDFLVVLNSRSAIQSFMAAGSLTLGGNLSIALGPLGRNGEAMGSVNTGGKIAAMYSYSKTRGLFGGVSLEGSVIMERQDANSQAYRSDVTAKMLLSGAVTPPEWTSILIKTLEACTGLPGNRQWVHDHNTQNSEQGYIFGNAGSPRDENGPTGRLKKKERPSFLRKGSSVSDFFDFSEANTPSNGTPAHQPDNEPDWDTQSPSGSKPSYTGNNRRSSIGWGSTSKKDEIQPIDDHPTTDFFETKFESDFLSNEQLKRHPRLSVSSQPTGGKEYPFETTGPTSAQSHRRSVSAYTPSSSSRFSTANPFSSSNAYDGRRDSYSFDDEDDHSRDVFGAPIPSAAKGFAGDSLPPPNLAPKTELTKPLNPLEGVARAIALYDFKAVQSGDLSFNKGQVITVTEKSGDTNTWWTGKVDGRSGIFPANFVEVV